MCLAVFILSGCDGGLTASCLEFDPWIEIVSAIVPAILGALVVFVMVELHKRRVSEWDIADKPSPPAFKGGWLITWLILLAIAVAVAHAALYWSLSDCPKSIRWTRFGISISGFIVGVAVAWLICKRSFGGSKK